MSSQSLILRADLFVKNNIGTKEQKIELMKQIREAQKTEKTSPNTNDGCWRSSHRFKNIDWLLNSVISLYEEADKQYCAENGGKDVFNVSGKTALDYWTNVNVPGSRNVLHSHRKSHFSCVYYVQGTGTGDLRLINPANILGDCDYIAPFARDFYYTPNDGDLILWPAWMPHEVEPNHSDRERINVVFDIGKVLQ